MSVSTTSNKNVLNGDGSTTVFPFTFQLPANSTGADIVIVIFDTSGNRTVLATNYTVDLVGRTVTYPVTAGQSPLSAGVLALPAGWQIVIMRIEALTQVLSLSTQGVWDGPSITAAFDALEYQIQQIAEQLGRCFMVPENEGPAPATVAAFLAAVSAVLPVFYTGTLDNLKTLSAASPTVRAFGFATDMGTVGQFGFYVGSTSVGDQGWVFFGGG